MAVSKELTREELYEIIAAQQKTIDRLTAEVADLRNQVKMTICASIAGCDVWEDIVDYCRVQEAWFRESLHMQLENGIPSHDTMQRVWGMIEPREFERCFCRW